MATQSRGTFLVHSSNGYITAYADNGEVAETQKFEDALSEYFDKINRIDIAEFMKTYNVKEMPDVDILDVGYWYVDGVYEEPTYQWRQECKELAEEAAITIR